MLEQVYDGMGVGASGEFLGQGGGERLGNRRLDEELSDLVALSCQDLLDQVVGHRPAAPAEVLDEGARGGVARQRHAGQSDSGCPTLGALHQGCEVVVVEFHVVLGEHGRGLVGSEGEVAERHVENPAVEPQLLEGERWFEPAAHHDTQPFRWWRPKQHFQLGQRVPLVEQVCVVDDEPDRLVHAVECGFEREILCASMIHRVLAVFSQAG